MAAAGDTMVVGTINDPGGPAERVISLLPARMPAFAGLGVSAGTPPTMSVSGTPALVDVWDTDLAERVFDADYTGSDVTLDAEAGASTVTIEVGLLLSLGLPSSAAVVTVEVYADGTGTGYSATVRGDGAGTSLDAYVSILVPGVAFDDVITVYATSTVSGTLTVNAPSQMTVKRVA